MYRFFETIPGMLAWSTLILTFLLSWKLPVFISIFIILFDLYWLLKTVYLALHLRATYKEMRENLKIHWLGHLKKLSGWQDIYHFIIFPMYKEPYDVVRESFESLLKTNYPKDKFIIVVTVEERAGAKAKLVAQKIENDFKDKFFKLFITYHPEQLPGEMPGKGSNETWGAREAKRVIIDPMALDYKKIIVSVFDVDTQVFPEYFGKLTHDFLTMKNPLRAIYQPIPLFINNIYKTPALARIVSFSATFWQMMQQSRPERLTSFSSQSIPFQALVDIDFWQKDIVSEDSRIFWQCFFHYHGDFRAEPMLYPVSMDANAAPTFWGTMKNTYKQQRRWAWGAENTPYLLEGFRKDREISWRKKWYWILADIEGRHSWATNSLMIFALGWLPIFFGGPEFHATLLSHSLPQVTRLIVSISMIGVASSAALAIVILPPKPEWFKQKHYLIYFFQWALIPITLNVFGAFPGLDAQTRLMLGGKFRLGFWVTPKHRSREFISAKS